MQHTILSGAKKTGVTLQTLDDKSFDHGIILAQTPEPFLPVPNWEHCTYHELLQFISTKAASMLVQGLRDRVFVPPLLDVGLSSLQDHRNSPLGDRIKHATKITPEDKKIDFLDWGGDKIYRHYRALGRLWTDVWIDQKTKKRLLFEDITLVDRPEIAWKQGAESRRSQTRPEKTEEGILSVAPLFIVASKVSDTWHPLLYIEDGDGVIFIAPDSAVRVGSIIVEGQNKKAASNTLSSLRSESAWRLREQTSPEAHGLIVEPVEAHGL